MTQVSTDWDQSQSNIGEQILTRPEIDYLSDERFEMIGKTLMWLIMATVVSYSGLDIAVMKNLMKVLSQYIS